MVVNIKSILDTIQSLGVSYPLVYETPTGDIACDWLTEIWEVTAKFKPGLGVVSLWAYDNSSRECEDEHLIELDIDDEVAEKIAKYIKFFIGG